MEWIEETLKENKTERPLIYQKNDDKVLNRVIIPKDFIDKYGRSFYMEVYKDIIVLIPIKKEK